MYDTGAENMKKAALSVKVRSFLSNQGEIDPSDLENPEDLEGLFPTDLEGLFPELLHDKISGGNGHLRSQLQSHPNHPHHQNGNNPHNNPQHYRTSGGTPLA